MGLGNCNTCHKYFDSIVKGNIHIQKMHAYGPGKLQGAYECVSCEEMLRTRNDLSQYMRIHNKIGMVKRKSVPGGFFLQQLQECMWVRVEFGGTHDLEAHGGGLGPGYGGQHEQVL